MRRYSSLTAPRRSKSAAPRAANSSLSQPTPTPTVTRPFDSTSIVASILAVSTGLRCGRIITLVIRRSRVLLAATNDMSVSCSSASPPPGNSPLTVYGYFDAIATGKTTWSAMTVEWKPSASPRSTSASSASGSALRPRVGR